MTGKNKKNRVPHAQGGKDATKRAISNHHDRFVRALLSDPEQASALLHDHLPSAIADRLADSLPEVCKDSYIDEALRLSQSDQLFKVQLRSGQPGFVYALVEHKSYPDPGLPLQLAGYQLRIWQDYAQGKAERLRALPPILPMVLYHGRQRWNVPLSLYDMIAGDKVLRSFAGRFGYRLCDLGALDPERLSSHAVSQVGFTALVQASRPPETEAELRTVLVRMLRQLPEGSVLEKRLVEYMCWAFNIGLEALEAAAREAKPERWEPIVGSIAETLIERGKTEGIAKGIAKGKAEGIAVGEVRSLNRLLERRFGPLPGSARERISGAGPRQIEAWLDAVLDAPDLDAVFATARH